ncbi:MAG: CBS domain-containing protein [Planctomycetaceae bacterium]
MICPHCDCDNIDGVDVCDDCGMPLVDLDPMGNELEQSITRHSIDVLCPRDPVSVDPSTTVRDAIAKMVAKKIGCLLVEERDELVGIFSERDVLNKIASDNQALDRPVGDFMTPSPVSISRQDSIAYALHAMKLGGYRHVPVVNAAGSPTGIISIRDILRFLCVRFAEVRSQVR